MYYSHQASALVAHKLLLPVFCSTKQNHFSLFALWKRFKSSCISCICLIMFFRGVTLFQFLLEVCFNLDTTCVTDLFINFEIDVSCFTLEMHSIILHRCACWEFIELLYSIGPRFHNTCMRIHVNSFQS